MIRSVAAGLVLAFLIVPGGPAPAQPADQVPALAGTWTCRSPGGALSTIAFRSAGAALDVEESAQDGAAIAHGRFEPDGAGWRVERETRYTHFAGRAPSWTGTSWFVGGQFRFADARTTSPSEIRFELLDANTLRRSFAPPGGEPLQGEVCARGTEPPNPALCAVHDVPATTIRPAMPDEPPLQALELRISGTVRVLVSLDAGSKVVDTSVLSTPSTLLNAAAVGAARRSTYRTAYHDCKPVPSKYVFAVDFSAN